jgi:AraC-like DNA-binding protein
MAMAMLRRREQAAPSAHAAVEPSALNWLFELLALALFTALAVAGWNLHMLVAESPRLAWSEGIEFCGNALLFYLTATVGIRRHIRFGRHAETGIGPAAPAGPDQPPSAADAGDADKGRYERTSLTEQRAQQLWRQVTHYMESKEPYLDCDLNLADLAAAVASYPRELSQVLNTVGQQSFYDFVNGYRAAKARALIQQDTRGAGMVDIALAAGFTGRSTLYKHFNKCFALTPSQFRKMCSAEARPA